MDRCEALVSATCICAAGVVWYSIYRRCRVTLTDVERSAARRGMVEWYGTRLASVVVVIGGIVHARRTLKATTAHLW